jgi:beta-glucosidase
MQPSPFPDDFLWGAATSAYQIEGSPLADGAGPSIWHRFCLTPGMVANGETGDVACDHYRRYRDDVRLMADLGLNAYRFSIAWSRILPEGRGRVNARGLAFYDRLVDALLEHGIEPAATLYHWDLPAALDDRGGWLNPDVADWFADYASVMFGALDDRVKLWATINEPWVITDGGYLFGALAPGHRNLLEAPIVAHNLLRSSARAVERYRADGRHKIGLVVNLEPKHPASDSEQDVRAARMAHAYFNLQYLDPVFFGRYPEELAEAYGKGWPGWTEEQAAEARHDVDFLGINYYTRSVVKHALDGRFMNVERVRQDHAIHTETDWELYPDSLRETLEWVTERYGSLPLYVTENGAAFYDPPSAIAGRVEDPLRVEYLRMHIRAAHQAIANGVDLRGYFAWSLFDNFEWSHGYSKRFGIVHVDYRTQERTPKRSAEVYREIIRSNGATLFEPSEEAEIDQRA